MILRINHAMNTLVCWRNKRFVVSEHGTFVEGSPFVLTRFADGTPGIEILGLACAKLRNLRNKIWRVKAPYLASIPEPNKAILLRSRHGYVSTP